MEQDLTFFAENGLTSTSANHIANLAKEYVKAQEQELESVEFYNTYLTIIGSDKEQRVQRGCTSQQLDDIAVKLRDISLANSLIAWLREAIKMRSQMLTDIITFIALPIIVSVSVLIFFMIIVKCWKHYATSFRR